MGYSMKLTTLDAIASFLAPVLSQAGAGPATYEWTHDKPVSLAYKIREGLALTQHYPDAYPWLTRLASNSRVRIFSKSKLVVLFTNVEIEAVRDSRILSMASAARIKQPEGPSSSQDKPETAEPSLEPSLEPMEPPAHAGKQLTHTEPAHRFDIVARWERAQSSPASVGRKIAFTNAIVTDLDLDKLAAWAAVQGWLVIANESGMVTLVQDHPDLRLIAWGMVAAGLAQ